MNPTFFKQTFRQIDFYRRVVSIDPQKVVDYISKKQTGEKIDISAEKISKVLGYIAPEDLQYTFEKNLDSYLATIKKGESNFPVDLTAIKKSIAKKGTDKDAQTLLAQIPDTYTPPQTNQTANKFFSAVPIGKILSYTGPIVAFVSLIFALMLWPSWRGRARFLGIVLLIFGMIILVAQFLAQKIPIPNNIIADFLDDILRDILFAAKAKILSLYFKESLAMAIAGLILFIVSFFIKSNPSPQTQQPSPKAA